MHISLLSLLMLYATVAIASARHTRNMDSLERPKRKFMCGHSLMRTVHAVCKLEEHCEDISGRIIGSIVKQCCAGMCSLDAIRTYCCAQREQKVAASESNGLFHPKEIVPSERDLYTID